MSAPPISNDSATTGGKKRKRTGKEREERKRLAIQAQIDAEKAEKPTEDSAATKSAPQEASSVVNNTGPEKQGVDVEKATKRIPQALKSLHPTFKQAKSFETRRLIKKIKFLRTKPDITAEVTDLEGQLSILHDIQLHPLAQSQILLKLRKHPLFKQTSLPSSITDLLSTKTPSVPTSSTSSTPSLVAKVENRLCSSKTVSEAIKNVIGWIVGEEGAKLSHPSKKESKNKVNEDEDQGNRDFIHPSRREMMVESDNEDVAIASDDNDEEGAGIGSDGEEDFEGDADEAGWESGSINGDDLIGSGSEDEDDDGDTSDEDAIPIPSTNKKAKLAPPTQPKPGKQIKEKQSTKSTSGKAEKIPLKGDITSSLFLPSLAAGFTRGDEGDSDPDEDIDPNGVIGKKTVERKNRRGQRARQAIWEKKYGKGAKHVVKAKEEDEAYQIEKAKRDADKRGKPLHMKGRDGGWGNRGTSTTTPTASGPVSAGVNPSSTYTNNKPTAVQPQPPKETQRNLHPSWEAARLRKQKMGTIPSGDAPKANKIVFD